ncbi:MAG: hypothetical protein KIT22_10120 [Verrucomicrobiae bacterium]|nr:hypothetical protein [Verrucomicrobiae bacterium]
MQRQHELIPPPGPEITTGEVEHVVCLLRGKDWITAAELLEAMGLPVTESAKRRIRAIASDSGGRIGGGQRGYKLVVEMTAEEYGHYDRWMAHQEAEMQRRRMESSQVFYSGTNPHRVPELSSPKHHT